MKPQPLRNAGFTLIEIIMVIVLLAILAGILTPMITQNIKAYSDSRARNEMMARGRIALGRLQRELRHAIPYSIVVSGTTLKFVTATAGGRYLQRAESPPKIANTDCDQNTERFYTSSNPDKLTGLCLLSPVPLPAAAADSDLALVIGNTSSASLYTYSDPGSWIGLSAATPPAQLLDVDYQGVVWKVTFVTPHSFTNGSSFKNYQIADFTHQITLSGNALLWRRANGISDPSSGAAATLISGVSAITFDTSSLATGLLRLSLTLSEDDETITMEEDIYVRNTP